MAEPLKCEIVRDLLPSYVDGLTCDVTNEAITRHMSDCTDCAASLKHMREPEQGPQSPVQEVDYLKKVRLRSRHVALLCALGAIVLVTALVNVKFYLVGSAALPTQFNYDVVVDSKRLDFSGSFLAGGPEYARTSFKEENGVVKISVYSAPGSLFRKGSFHEQYMAQGKINAVYLGNLIAWENGTSISRTAAQVFAVKNPYVGDMTANGEVASALGISDQFGSYRNELQTSTEPYGWALLFDTPIAANEEHAAREIMAANSYVMLAVIDNLGYVTWEYKTENSDRTYTVTAEDASEYAGRDIKQCAKTATSLQELMQSLSTKWSGVRDVVQQKGTFHLSVTNLSDSEVYGLKLNYYLGGELLGSRGAENADGTPLDKRDTLLFDFVPDDFPSNLTAISLSQFSFDLSVTDAAGNEIVVCENTPVSAKYAWTFYYTLTGSYENGFALSEG